MISVIVPAYNAEKTIAPCIESLVNQSYPGKYEIIVVDDGSKDNTAKAAENFRQAKIIRQKHSGPAVTRNHGVQQSSGDIIIFTDSDCVADRKWIEEMLKPFENKEISGVQGRYKTRQKRLISRFAQYEIEDRYDKLRGQKFIDFVSTYSAAYRKAAFNEVGGFSQDFQTASGEDPEVSFKLAKKGYKMVFNPNAIVYHLHPETLTDYLRTKFWRAFWRILLYKKHPSKITTESYTPQTLKVQIASLYLFLAFVALAILYQPAVLASLIMLALFVALSFPVSIKNFRKDKAVGIISPFIIMLRTVAFSLGLLCGFIRFGRA